MNKQQLLEKLTQAHREIGKKQERERILNLLQNRLNTLDKCICKVEEITCDYHDYGLQNVIALIKGSAND